MWVGQNFIQTGLEEISVLQKITKKKKIKGATPKTQTHTHIYIYIYIYIYILFFCFWPFGGSSTPRLAMGVLPRGWLEPSSVFFFSFIFLIFLFLIIDFLIFN
jgi:small-conductance mechanosensitive channel